MYFSLVSTWWTVARFHFLPKSVCTPRALRMSAISTSLLALVPVGASVVFSRPVYGGTDLLLEEILPERGIVTREFPAGAEAEEVERICVELEEAGTPPKVIFL